MHLPAHVTAHLILQTIAWLLAVAWLYKFLSAARGLPTVPDLTLPAYDLTPTHRPSLTVIVPARNEALNIRACLETLLAQDYLNLKILAVDDRSTDPTGQIMDTLAQAHPIRLEVLHITDLPPGWLGKTHAMAVAARHALAQSPTPQTHSTDPLRPGTPFIAQSPRAMNESVSRKLATPHPLASGGPFMAQSYRAMSGEGNRPPDYLLFTDGDILFHPQILRRALAYAEKTEADHLFLLPTTLAHSPGEAALLAYIQVMSLWAVRPWRIADPRARDAAGVGAFNLLRTAAYLHLGGFDAMPVEIVEDVTLGRRVKAAGLRQRVAHAPGAVQVHWADGVLGILHGMTKNLFAVFYFSPVRLLGGAVSLGLFCLVPFAFLTMEGGRLPVPLMLASIVGLYVLSSRRSGISALYAAAFPVAALLFVYAILRSMCLTLYHGGVTWRGTFYPLATLRNPTQK